MSDLIVMSCPCPSQEVAAQIARAALKARLVACANLHGPMRSLYHWQSRIEDEPEWLVEMKSMRVHVPALVALIRAEHPYELPAITWVEADAERETADWVKLETGLN